MPKLLDQIPALLRTALTHADLHRRWHAYESIRCGALCLAAKEELGHGNFEDWLKSPTVGDLGAALSTLRNYMKVATVFMREKKLSIALVSKSRLLTGGVDSKDSAIAGGQNDKICAALVAWVGDRTLTEIYRDTGIAREKDPHQQHTPSERTGQMTFKDIDRGWANLTTQITALGHVDQSWAELSDERAWEFLDTTVPVVRNLATTKNLTRDQRKRLETELVTITTALRGAGK